MNRNLQALVKACDQIGVRYDVQHSTQNIVTVYVGGETHLFTNWATPLNPQSVMKLCQDKDYFITYFEDVVKMPKTAAFLNPYSDEKYAHFLDANSIGGIISKVEADFGYPVIVKKNRGSWGTHVFKAETPRQLEHALLAVYDKKNIFGDYIALIQEAIPIEREYRIIYLNGRYQFAYHKDTANAVYTGNLSPLHWEGAESKLVTDAAEQDALIAFCQPLFDKLMIPFCGLDVAVDAGGQHWMIEGNSSPGFDRFIKDEGDEMVVKLYKEMLSPKKA